MNEIIKDIYLGNVDYWYEDYKKVKDIDSFYQDDEIQVHEISSQSRSHIVFIFSYSNDDTNNSIRLLFTDLSIIINAMGHKDNETIFFEVF